MLLFLLPLLFVVTVLGIVVAMLRDAHGHSYPSARARAHPASPDHLQRLNSGWREELLASLARGIKSLARQPRRWMAAPRAVANTGERARASLRTATTATSTRARSAGRASARAEGSPRTSTPRVQPFRLSSKLVSNATIVGGMLAIAVFATILVRTSLDGETAGTADTSASMRTGVEHDNETDEGGATIGSHATSTPPAAVPPAAADGSAAAAMVTRTPTPAPTPAPTPTAPPPPTPAPPTGAATLALAAQQDANVRVTVDGSVVFSGTLPAGQTQSWGGSQRVQVWTDNGQNLHVTVNGHTLGALSAAVGNPGWSRVDWGWSAGWSP